MPVFDGPSRCSGPGTPIFRWYGYPTCDPGRDIETAVEALVAAISPPGRVWNPHALIMAKSEFKNLLLRGSRGELKPIDEVKPVDVRNPPPMYELRWQGVAVTNRAEDGTISYATVLVRLYHSEPDAAPGYFIGHHAHEKDLDAPDVWAAQSAEIATAYGWYAHGRDLAWGIASS